jgi:hypothetical protein
LLSALLFLMLAAPLSHPRAAAPTPVVVELFTSEGCSDCPAADALLDKLLTTQPIDGASIVALGQHVDYWDRLGWRDRFSSAAFTDRQRVYGAHFNTESIYTPQMVVDGGAEFVGSDAAAARRAIAKAAAALHGLVRIVAEPPSGSHLSVAMSTSDLPKIGGDHADMVIAVTEDGLKTDVKRGENHGRTLTHAAVVRQMITIGEASTGAVSTAHGEITLDADWQRDRLKIVAFVQERRGRRILASAAEPLPMTRR